MNAPAPARPDVRRAAPGWAAPDPGGRMLGRLPLVNVVVLETGLALALLLLAVDSGLLPLAAGIAVVGAGIAAGRLDRRWLTEWLPARIGYALRSRERSAASAQGVLALAAPGLRLVPTTGHDRIPLALLHDGDEWASVLLVRPSASLLTSTGAGVRLPLPTLATCLEDRGVLLRRIRVVWHSAAGSTALPAGAPAALSYREVLGSLPTVARRTTWVTVGLDPMRCPEAVAERGGGETGARRALVGATSRVRRALTDAGVGTGVLDEDGVRRAGLVALDLTSIAGHGGTVDWREQWDCVVVGGIAHRVFALTGFPVHLPEHAMEALTAIRAQSVTVALAISTGAEMGTVRVNGLVRVSACRVEELRAVDHQLRAAAEPLGISLRSLHGNHGTGLAATLPLVGT